MTSARAAFPFALSILLAAALGCASPEQVWVPPVVDVLPSSGGGAWTFDAAGAHHPDFDDVPAPMDAGALRASAKDQASGYAAALYDGAMAIVDVENDLVEWTKVDLPKGPASLCIGGAGVGAIAGTTAALFALPSGRVESTFELKTWLRRFDVPRAAAFVPLSRTEFLLVASRLPAAFQDSRVVVQRIDTEGGAWELLRGEGDVAGLNRLGAVTAVEGTLYIAGVRERLSKGAGQKRGSLHQNVVAYRYDPQTGTSRQVVDEHQIAMDPRVLDLAAGRDPITKTDLLAVLNATGELKVYDVPVEGVSSAPRYSNKFPGAARTAWVGPTTIAVALETGEVRFVEVTR